MSTDLTVMSEDEARRLTERIRLNISTAADVLGRLGALVSEAYERRADLALGYGSWAAYSSTEFGEDTAALAAPIRRQLVGYLTGEQMPSTAIAPVMGTSHQAVNAMQHRIKKDELATQVASSPDPTPRTTVGLDGKTRRLPQRPAEPEPTEYAPEPKRDGKTYSRPAAPPKRETWPDEYRHTVIAIQNAQARLDRLHTDRQALTRNAEKAAAYRSDLLRAISAFQRAVADLDQATA